AERVYFHHAKVAAGVMIGRALHEMLSRGEFSEPELYKLSDEALIDKFAASKNEISQMLGNGLRARRLFKRCGEITRTKFREAHDDHNRNFFDLAKKDLANRVTRTEIENQICEEVGVQAGRILLYFPQKGMNMKLARTLMVWGGEDIRLAEIKDP